MAKKTNYKSYRSYRGIRGKERKIKKNSFRICRNMFPFSEIGAGFEIRGFAKEIEHQVVCQPKQFSPLWASLAYDGWISLQTCSTQYSLASVMDYTLVSWGLASISTWRAQSTRLHTTTFQNLFKLFYLAAEDLCASILQQYLSMHTDLETSWNIWNIWTFSAFQCCWCQSLDMRKLSFRRGAGGKFFGHWSRRAGETAGSCYVEKFFWNKSRTRSFRQLDRTGLPNTTKKTWDRVWDCLCICW